MGAARINPIEPERWLEFARDDLAYGESGMANHPRPAAWSFQQAGEKSLKAVFLHRGLKVPRTRDVAFLLSILAESMAVAPGVGEAAPCFSFSAFQLLYFQRPTVKRIKSEKTNGVCS